jgi:hypothetical protein
MGTKMVQMETGKYGWSVITVDGNTHGGGRMGSLRGRMGSRVQRFDFFLTKWSLPSRR